MMNNAILNDVFLNQLFRESNREIFAKVTSLTQDENAIETIEGKVSGGSISVDGKSAIRRTCSLNLVAKDIEINEFYWGIRNKFKLEIGLLNEVDSNYEDIIWFPQGIFLISNFDVNQTTKDCKITIKGKDKMCLLNGEFSGHLPHETDFGKIDVYDSDTDTKTTYDVPIKTIIQEAVRNFGSELPHNIIINDIENAGLELLEYRGKTPMYMFRTTDSDMYSNITFNEEQKCYVHREDGKLKVTTINDSESIIYDSLVDLESVSNPTPVILTLIKKEVNEEQFNNGVFYKLFKQYYVNENDEYYTDNEYYFISSETVYERAYEYDPEEEYYEAEKEYYIAEFGYGSTPGYKLTELTYAGDLIAKAGETVTSVLDKIKKMLGEFEYFYNLDGKFVFQKQKKYNASNWQNNEEDEVIYNDSTLNMEKPIFNLLDNKLITSFKNSPKITDLKNDYSVWGTRKMDSGTERTIHARYAIDKKPIFYKSFEGKYYIADKKLYDSYLYQVKQSVIDEIYEKIYSYKLQYSVPDELTKPERQSDGSWSPGWWDIRDWASYYKLMQNTEEDPKYTMKWYSQNDETGCVSLNTIPGYENDTRYYSVWLIIKTQSGKYDISHGSGNYPGTPDHELCYYSVLDDSPEGYSTYKTSPPQYKDFYSPYKFCTETHTYLKFLKSDVEKKGNLVYFYNPKFIMGDFDSLTEDLIDNKYQELINNGTISFVDWREIIYQMSLDYYSHNHEDDFLYTLAQNNLDYYPTGVTGYERYYVDLNGFWRDLYNPNPDPLSTTITYKEANDAHIEDTLYITNSFRHLFEDEMDSEIIDIEQLYVLDYSGEIDDKGIPSTPEIIPFLGSEYCHLNYNEDKTASDDVYFFEDEEGNMNDGVDDIAELNAVNLYEIYIKERAPFITLEGYKNNIDQMTEEIKAVTPESYKDAEKFINYFSTVMDIRDKYYSESNRGEEDRRPFYVRGEVKPGEEWPEWSFENKDDDDDDETTGTLPSGTSLPEKTLFTSTGNPILTYDNKLFLIQKVNTYNKVFKAVAWEEEAESIYKFWVFKYPFGTYLGQYPDDYTNYAAQQLEEYLNKYGWDNLYIRNSEPVKFSELDQVIQRLYYKQAEYLTEYLNIVQYDNFNTLKTNYTTLSLCLPQVAPSSYDNVEDYEDAIKSLCKYYCGEYGTLGKQYVQAIYAIKRKNYDTQEEYEEKLYDLYDEFLSKLQEQYTSTLNKPDFKVEFVRYSKVYYDFNTDKDSGNYWIKLVSESPEQLDFWFDFINGETSFLSKYSVQAIGPRSKVVNDSTVKAIYYKEVPNTIFITSQKEYEDYDHQTGYTYMQLPAAMNSVFVTSSRGKSAKDAVEDLIYTHSYATETVTLQTLPIYHLQPNTCLYIRNNETNIDGDYLISKLTVPLDSKKMMSITATKVMPSII